VHWPRLHVLQIESARKKSKIHMKIPMMIPAQWMKARKKRGGGGR
jgi:hypothetical protein